MPEIKIITKAPKLERSLEVMYDMPDTVEGLVEKFGAEAVVAGAAANIKIDFQAAVRRQMEANKTDEEIVSVMGTWKPGDKLSLPTDPVARIRNSWGVLTEDQKAALMAELASAQ